jgi:hypothetical protein
MEVEIRKKGNCVSQYNTLTGKDHINVISDPCKSKRGFTELRRQSCVSFGVYCCELWTETRSVIFVSSAVNYCHYACGRTNVTVRSIHIMYRYLPSLPTIYNYHPSALIILILQHNVIAVQHKQKDRHPNIPCHCTVTLRSAPEDELKYRLCK